MVRLRGRWFSIAVAICVVLHFWWAALILFGDGTAVHATALFAVYRFVGWGSQTLTGLALVFVAALALWGMLTRRPWIVVSLLPQQVVLMISLIGAVQAIWLQQFADGVERPFAFIAADQIDTILLALGHTAAVISHWYRLNEK